MLRHDNHKGCPSAKSSSHLLVSLCPASMNRLDLHAQALHVEKLAMPQDRAVALKMPRQGGQALAGGGIVDQS